MATTILSETRYWIFGCVGCCCSAPPPRLFYPRYRRYLFYALVARYPSRNYASDDVFQNPLHRALYSLPSPSPSLQRHSHLPLFLPPFLSPLPSPTPILSAAFAPSHSLSFLPCPPLLHFPRCPQVDGLYQTSDLLPCPAVHPPVPHQRSR